VDLHVVAELAQFNLANQISNELPTYSPSNAKKRRYCCKAVTIIR